MATPKSGRKSIVGEGLPLQSRSEMPFHRLLQLERRFHRAATNRAQLPFELDVRSMQCVAFPRGTSPNSSDIAKSGLYNFCEFHFI